MHAALTCVVGAPRYFPPRLGALLCVLGLAVHAGLLGALLVALLWSRSRSRARAVRPPAWIEAVSELLDAWRPVANRSSPNWRPRSGNPLPTLSVPFFSKPRSSRTRPRPLLAHTPRPARFLFRGPCTGDPQTLAASGRALRCDATLVSPLTRAGEPRSGTATLHGAVLRTALRRKHDAYPERRASPMRARLRGGRWSTDAVMLVRRLAALRALRALRLCAHPLEPRGRTAGGESFQARSNRPLVTLCWGAPGPCRVRHASHRRDAITFRAFLDIRKAFDVTWKHGALLRLYHAGVQDGLWHLFDDLISDRTAFARIQSTMSDDWDV